MLAELARLAKLQRQVAGADDRHPLVTGQHAASHRSVLPSSTNRLGCGSGAKMLVQTGTMGQVSLGPRAVGSGGSVRGEFSGGGVDGLEGDFVAEAFEALDVVAGLAAGVRAALVSSPWTGHAGPGACVCDLTDPLGLTQPTISRHLKVLVDAGIFNRDQRGKWAYYALVPRALDALSAVLSTTA